MTDRTAVNSNCPIPDSSLRRALPANIQPLTEQDDEMELAHDLFHELCSDRVDGNVGNEIGEGNCNNNRGSRAILSLDKIREAIRRRQSVTERALLEALEANLLVTCKTSGESASQDIGHDSYSSTRAKVHEISFEHFFQAFQAVPRVRGERLRWAGTLGIEAALARLLRRGDAFDGLRGLRQLDAEAAEEYAQEVSARLSAALPGLLQAGLRRLRSAAMSAQGPAARTWANAKFVADGLTVGRFATLEDFYKGPEALIGVPNPRIEEGMRKEHCERDNAETEFRSTNYNIVTCPRLEWEMVVTPVPGKAYPHTPWERENWPADCKWWGSHGREVIGVDALLQRQEVREMAERVGLRREEAVGLRLYTGPMFVLYNAALRGLPQRDVEYLRGNQYETTIFVIASGVTKLSKATIVPATRLLYRGLSGDLVLPDQFWHAHAECTVTLLVRTGSAEAAAAAACALASRVEAEDPSLTGRAATLGELRGGRLVLAAPQTKIQAASADTGAQDCQATGILLQANIVLAKVISGDDVRLVVVLPGTRRMLQGGTLDRLVEAVRACCSVGRSDGPPEVRVEDVAEKPEGFRGGVELGLLSLSESRSTALLYGGEACGRRGTVFEVQVGRVDIGASIGFLSQYPGEREYLMPPLSCLEVVGEPRLDRTETEDVIVVPMRINVNLKSPTVEDLIGRRKLLHAAATKNLREELARSAEEQAEVFGGLLARRRCGALELLRGVRAHVSLPALGSSPVKFVGRTWATLWAPYLTVSSGRVFFEVEVVTAEGTLGAGFAGTRYSSTVGADVGDDEISWAIFSFDKARHGGNSKKLDTAVGWFVPGAVLGVAADLDRGRMLTSVLMPSDAQSGHSHATSVWEEVYAAGVGPSQVAGGALFPILTGGWGASGICNFGHRPAGMRHSPPASDYCTLADAMKEELLAVGRGSASDGSATGNRAYVKEAEEILDGLNVGRTALLRGFDVVKRCHENMPAEDYNDDSVYRDSLDHILTAKVCAERKQAVIVELLESGAAPLQLKVVRNAPEADFQHIRTGKLGSDSECVDYSWRLVFSGWFRFLHAVEVPIDTAPSLIALVFYAVLSAGPVLNSNQERTLPLDGLGNRYGLRTVVLGGRKVPVASLIPSLRLQTTMLHSQRFENALLGLVLVACGSEDLKWLSRSADIDTIPTNILADADFRNLEYSQERTLQLASIVVHGHIRGTLSLVNGLRVSQPTGQQILRECISRANDGTSQVSNYRDRQMSVLELGGRLDLIDWGLVMARAAIGRWKVLNLSNNGLGLVAALGISVGIVSVHSLTELNLSHNCLQLAGISAISSSLTALTALLHLELGQNSLRQDGATALAKHLPKLSQLKVLGLANNNISDLGAAAVCKSISSGFTWLCKLDLSTNALGPVGGDALAKVLPGLYSLTVLGLEGQDVGSAVWHVLAGLIPRATSIAVDTGIVTVFCIPVHASLMLNPPQDDTAQPSAVELIRRHALGPDGSRRLANILMAGRSISASRLTKIDLSYNGILAEGATALAPALAGLSVLTRLGLTKNNIGLEGAKAIAGALRRLVKLHSLSLDGNNIGAAGWAVLADAVEDLTSLHVLNGFEGYSSLRAGGISTLEVSGQELAAAVASILQHSAPTLSVLDNSGYQIQLP